MNIDFNNIFKWITYNPSQPIIFQSVEFFILFGIFYFLYTLFHKNVNLRNLLLLFFCLFFYYKLSGFFVLILMGMALFDYLMAWRIFHSKNEIHKRLFLYASVLLNVGALIYFKYTYFFINLINDISGSGISLTFKILQPIGISYYVFKSLTYVYDVNREVIEKPEPKFQNYLLYVSFFPNILAGPISKARDLLPQFSTIKIVSKKEINTAIFFISIGLIKKIAIADFIAANFSDRVFESPQFFTSFDLFMSSYAGLLQLFFDFSGYTDIVIGIALLLGFEIYGNFNQPFKAKNISQFWERWHISLYAWLSDYVYQPIAFGLRKYKKAGIILAVLITFLISGIWHGANFTFIVWGLLHGSVIAFEMISQRFRDILNHKLKYFYVMVSVFLTFNFLAFSSILINSPNISFAFEFYEKMFTNLDFKLFSKWLSIYYAPFLAMLAGLLLQYLPLQWYSSFHKVFLKIPVGIISLLFTVLLILLYQISTKEALPFVYMEF